MFMLSPNDLFGYTYLVVLFLSSLDVYFTSILIRLQKEYLLENYIEKYPPFVANALAHGESINGEKNPLGKLIINKFGLKNFKYFAMLVSASIFSLIFYWITFNAESLDQNTVYLTTGILIGYLFAIIIYHLLNLEWYAKWKSGNNH